MISKLNTLSFCTSSERVLSWQAAQPAPCSARCPRAQGTQPRRGRSRAGDAAAGLGARTWPLHWPGWF